MPALHICAEEWDGNRFTRAPHSGLEELLCSDPADPLALLLKFSNQNDLLRLVAPIPRSALKFHRVGELTVFRKLYFSYRRVPGPSLARSIHLQIDAAWQRAWQQARTAGRTP